MVTTKTPTADLGADFDRPIWRIYIAAGPCQWKEIGTMPSRAEAEMHVQSLRRLLPAKKFAIAAVMPEGQAA